MTSLRIPGVVPVTLLADVAERLGGFVRGHRPAGAEHPDSLFLLHWRSAAPGAQRDRVALDGKVEGVAGREVQLIPEFFGKDDAARLVEGHFATH
jgi:hypothetical protein